MDLSNPKAAAFFTSLFALAAPPASPLWFQALLAALAAAMGGAWYALVAVAVNARPWRTDPAPTARLVLPLLHFLVDIDFQFQ